jgi:hypothetical protein
MNPRTLVCVSAYAGDEEQVRNNMPVYIHHKCPVVIFSPSDAPIYEMLGATCLIGGLKGWTGPQTLRRHVRFLELMLAFPFDHYLFNDSDSFCLSPEFPRYLYDDPNSAWSNEVTDTNPGPSRLPKIAMQPPYFFSRAVLEGLLKADKNPPTSYYGDVGPSAGGLLPVPTECIDHYHMQLVMGSGFGHKTFFHGASFETGTPNGLNTMSELVRNHGRVLVHSVKTKPILDRLRADRKEYLRTHPDER